MNEASELLEVLNTREKKHISNQLKKTGKNQLLEKYHELKRFLTSKSNSIKSNKEKAKDALLSYQLKEFILEELVIYKQSNAIEIEFRQQLSEIEFLKSKFLHSQALKKIKVLKPRLLKYERFSFLTQLLLIETEIQYFNLSEYHFGVKLDEIVKQYDDYSNKNIAFYSSKIQFYTQLAGISKIGISESIINSELNIKKSDIKSANYFYLRSSLIRSLISNEITTAVKIGIELIDLTEVNSHEFDRLPFQKMEVYFMSGIAFLIARKMHEYHKCVAQIKAIYESYPILITKYKERINYLYWVEASTSKSNYLNEEDLIKTFNAIRGEISIEFNLRIVEQISNYYIDRDSFVIANKWNRDILNQPKKLQQVQFIQRAKFRAIYIAIEQEKIDLAETFINRILLSRKEFNLNKKLVLLFKEFHNKRPELQTELYKTIHFWKDYKN